MTLPPFIANAVNGYADEARTIADKFHQDGTAYGERICARLEAIRDAIQEDEWLEGRETYDMVLNGDLGEVPNASEDGFVAVVPQGTAWVAETMVALMNNATATVVIRANGALRAVASVGASGVTTSGSLLFRGAYFNPGDTITVNTVGLGAGELMTLYLQFRARQIRAPLRRTGGIPEVAADRPNDQAEELSRHGTPGVFLDNNVRGEGAPRGPHDPPMLPRVR